MNNILDKAKKFVRWNLKRNIQTYLQNNYDWKVSKAISTGIPLAEEDINFRERVLADFNNRLALVDAATSIADLDKIRLSF